MKPVALDNVGENNKEITKDDFISELSNKEILNIIDKNISIKNRPIFLKMMGGSKVPKNEIKKLLHEIKKILQDHHDIQS